MPVKESADGPKDRIRSEWNKPPEQALLPVASGYLRLLRILPVTKLRTGSPPVFLKRYEPEIGTIRTPHFELGAPLDFRLLDRVPKQKSHSSKPMKSLIAATIFVNHGLLVSQGEDARNRQTVLGSNSNLQVLSERRDQPAKPGNRLWGQTLPPSGNHEKVIKL